MKRSFAFLLCLAIFLPYICVPVKAQENYNFNLIYIDTGSGAARTKAVVQDGEIYIPATNFPDYTRFSYDEESRTFLVKGQELNKAVKYVMIDIEKKRMLVSGKKFYDLSDCFEVENELYLPLCQMLPVLNADIYEVKDNIIYISNNNLSLAEVLYDFDIANYYYNIAAEFYDVKAAAALAIVPSYIWDSVVSARFDRLDIFYGSGEYNDYKDAFSDFLSEDNLYLKAMAQDPSKIDPIVELFNGANNVAKDMKSVYGWIEAAGKSDISTETGGALLDALKECYDSGELEVDDLKGINDAWTSGKISFGDCIEILTYVYTYVTQVEDNRQMLNAVYSVDSKINKAETARRAAKQVYDLYGDNVVPALHKEILTTVAGGALEDLSPIGIYTATAKVSGLVFKNIIPYDPEEVAKLPIYSDIVLSASSKYHLYDFSTDEGTKNLRLSLLLCMMASKKCFEVMGDVFEAESTHYKNKIEKIEQLIMGLYIAEENTAFDSHEHFEEYREVNLAKIERLLNKDSEENVEDLDYYSLIRDAEIAAAAMEWDKAAKYLEDAIELKPNIAENYLFLATAYVEKWDLYHANETLNRGYTSTQAPMLKNVSIWGPLSPFEIAFYMVDGELPLTRCEYFFTDNGINSYLNIRGIPEYGATYICKNERVKYVSLVEYNWHPDQIGLFPQHFFGILINPMHPKGTLDAVIANLDLEYNANGDITAVTIYDDGTPIVLSLDYQDGNCTSVASPQGEVTVSYDYDSKNRISGIVVDAYDDEYSVVFEYQDDGFAAHFPAYNTVVAYNTHGLMVGWTEPIGNEDFFTTFENGRITVNDSTSSTMQFVNDMIVSYEGNTEPEAKFGYRRSKYFSFKYFYETKNGIDRLFRIEYKRKEHFTTNVETGEVLLSYDEAGNVVRIQRNPNSGDMFDMTLNYLNGRLDSIVYTKVDLHSRITTTYKLYYDRVGRLIDMDDF